MDKESVTLNPDKVFLFPSNARLDFEPGASVSLIFAVDRTFPGIDFFDTPTFSEVFRFPEAIS